MTSWKPQNFNTSNREIKLRKPPSIDYSDLSLSNEGIPDVSVYVGESKAEVRPSYTFAKQQGRALSFRGRNWMDKEASDDCPRNPQDEVQRSTFTKRSHSVILPSARNAGRDSFICVICLDDVVSVEDTAELGCHHRFCKSCVANQVRAQLDLNRFPITCLQENCDHDLAGELPALIPNALYQRYLDLSLKSCVGQIDDLKQCLTPDCPGLYEMEPGNNVLNCCICKSNYCLKCSRPAHEGLLCNEQLKGDEIERYLKENRCNQCPQCKFWVEKSGGCNHMTCRCKFEFCFVCGLKWSYRHQCQLDNKKPWFHIIHADEVDYRSRLVRVNSTGSIARQNHSQNQYPRMNHPPPLPVRRRERSPIGYLLRLEGLSNLGEQRQHNMRARELSSSESNSPQRRAQSSESSSCSFHTAEGNNRISTPELKGAHFQPYNLRRLSIP